MLPFAVSKKQGASKKKKEWWQERALHFLKHLAFFPL